MVFVLIPVSISCLVAIIVLIIGAFWVYIHNYVPRLPHRKKWPPIALSIGHVVVFLFFVGFVIFHLTVNSNKAEKSLQEIDKVIKKYETTSNTVKTELTAIEIPTIPPSATRFSQSRGVVTIIQTKTGFDKVKIPNTQNLELSIQLINDMRDINKCNSADINLNSIDALMKKTSEVYNDVSGNITSLQTKYRGFENHLFDKVVPKLDTKLAEEKPQMDTYLTSMKAFFEKFVSSLKITKTEVVKNMGQSNESSTFIEELLTIYLPAGLVFVFGLVSVLHNCNLFKPNISRFIATFLHIAFYVLLLTTISLSIWQFYRFSQKSTNDCPQKRFDLVKGVTVKAFNSDNAADIDVNDALLRCGKRHEKFFTGSDNGIRIKESIFIRNYKKEFLDGALDTFKYNNEFDKAKLLKGIQDAKDLYDKMEEFINKCTDAAVKTTVEDYRDALRKAQDYLGDADKFAENLKTIATIVPPLVETHLRTVKEPLSKPVDDINKVLANSDIDCREVVDAFSNGFNPCKLANRSILTWAQCIAIVCCTLTAVIYLLAFRRSDKTQFKYDSRQIWVRILFSKYCPPYFDRRRKVLRLLAKPVVNEIELCPHDKTRCRSEADRCIRGTRVVLKNRPNDFIHASWVRIAESKRSYIVTQAPLDTTCADFWAMCDQENVKTILMLCTIQTDKENRYIQYYPEAKNQELKFENFQVACTEVKKHPVDGVDWRVLTLSNSTNSGAKPKIINHYRVIWWQKDTSPITKNFVEFYNWIEKMNKGSAPICVHSILGTGRAGTYVFFDYSYTKVKTNQYCNLSDMFMEVRSMRHNAVTEQLQYEFVEYAIVEATIQEGIIERFEAEKYTKEFNETGRLRVVTLESSSESEKSEKTEKTKKTIYE